jgi:pimeloyl-ACP methyl ester carboxylesterase
MEEYRKATVEDVELCYRIVGEGRPLVMIIGFTANMDWWNPVLVDALSRQYLLLLFDNRGAGRSTYGTGRFTMGRFAGDTAGLMDELGIDRACVMANSMGGMIAQKLALSSPDRVEKLVLNCTMCGGVRSKLPSMAVIKRMAGRAGTQAENMRKNIDLLFPPAYLEEHPETVDNLVAAIERAPATPRLARRQAVAIAGFSTYRSLPRIECPALVMAGTEDVLIPPENARILADRIPDSTLRFFEGGGHRFTAQYPLEVAEAVCDFIEGA